MIDCNQLPGHLADICRGSHRHADGRAYSLHERTEIVARRLRVPADTITLPTSELPEPMPKPLPQMNSGIGTRLKAIINRAEPGVVTCSTCRETIEELNAMTPEEVLADLDQYINDMAHRAREQAPKLWQRIAVKLDLAVASAVDAATGIDMSQTKERIRSWIIEACEVPDPA